MNGVMIFDYEKEGFGLMAEKDLKEGECILSIPKELVMSEETARKSYLGI